MYDYKRIEKMAKKGGRKVFHKCDMCEKELDYNCFDEKAPRTKKVYYLGQQTIFRNSFYYTLCFWCMDKIEKILWKERKAKKLKTPRKDWYNNKKLDKKYAKE